MEPKVNYSIVGLFIVVLGVTLLVVVLWLGKGDYRAAYDNYYTYMRESVAGLSIDSAVRYNGVDVGRVRELIINPDNPEEVRLTLAILHGTPVKVDTAAVLVTQGLTGLTTVDLTGGTRDAPLLVAQTGQPFPVIKSKPSLYFRLEASVSRLLSDDALPQLLADLDGLTRDARVVVDEQNRRALRKILGDLAKVTSTVAVHRAAIDRMLVTATQAMESFAHVGKKVEEQLPHMIDETKSTFHSLQKMTGDIARVGRLLEGALDDNRANIEQFTRQTLVDAGALVFELRELTATLQRVAKELDEEPSSLVFGRSRQPRGPGE
jgi:phospholipid/cholesterol/gamma-HCH transport system substrate-binding protein